MKEVKIFLASSINEFRNERFDLGDFIRKLTDQTIEQDVYLKFSICEDMSNAVSKDRKQGDYNEEIRNSDFFYVIFGNKAGDYTIEELEVAAKQFKESADNKPNIYVYHQKSFENTTISEQGKEALECVKKENINISYRDYTNIDDMKIEIAKDLLQKEAFNGELTIEKEKVFLNGKKLFAFEKKASATEYYK